MRSEWRPTLSLNASKKTEMSCSTRSIGREHGCNAGGARGQRGGRVLTVEERGKVAAKELVLCVTEYVVYCSVAMENCTLLGEDEDGDVDELGNDGIGPALLAGELEWLLLGGSRVLGWLLVLVLVLVGLVAGKSRGGVVDRDWVLH